MKEENKKSKKKVLLTYLILAVCLLVIAAVTVTVILTVKSPAEQLIDSDQNQPDDNPDDGDNDDENKPTNTPVSYCLPVTASASVATRFVFAYDVTLDRYCVHRGVDFEGKAGDEVCAVLDGKVTAVVMSSLIGENYVTISHDNGVTSTYKYIDAKSGLKVGDTVKRGDVIGTIAVAAGMEMKQGEHLHFEMRTNGKISDPESYIDIIEK